MAKGTRVSHRLRGRTRQPAGPRETTRVALQRGRELYGQGRFFEAHEVWEGAWLAEQGDVRLLLHALIQVAAAYVKAVRDLRPDAAVKLLDSATRKLSQLPDKVAGVELRPFRLDLALAIEAAHRWRDGASECLEARPPILHLDGESRHWSP